MTARIFELYTPEQRGIIGELDEDGVVTFAIHAGEGSSIRGTEMFKRMMQHFGDDVRAIRGVWRKYRDRPSANIDKVNELTGTGTPISEAILHGWTVTRAAKLGYCRVRLIGIPEGRPGAYTQIDVWIEK